MTCFVSVTPFLVFAVCCAGVLTFGHTSLVFTAFPALFALFLRVFEHK